MTEKKKDDQGKEIKDGPDHPVAIEEAPAGLVVRIRDWAAAHVKPPLVGLQAKTIESGGKRVHVVYAPPSPLRPHQASDLKYWQRSTDGSVALDHQAVDHLFRVKIAQELNREPFVKIDETLQLVLRTGVCELHLSNVGNSPATNLEVRLGTTLIETRAALGESPDSWKLRVKGDPVQAAWLAGAGASVTIAYQDTAGARYTATYALELKPGGGPHDREYRLTGALTRVRAS